MIHLSLGAMVAAFFEILVAGLIFWLLYWLVGVINPPEPFKKIVIVILAIIVVIFLINVLLSLFGAPVFVMDRRV